MKKSLMIIGAVVVISLFLCGCAEEKKPVTNPLADFEYQNLDHDFGLNHPDGWTTDEDDQFGVVRFYGPVVDTFTINLGIAEPGSLETGKTLNDLIQDMKDGYPTLFTDFVFISSDSRTFNGMSGYDFVYTFTQGIYSLKGEQILIEKNGIIYTFTYTSPVDSYDAYLSIVEDSINTFTVV